MKQKLKIPNGQITYKWFVPEKNGFEMTSTAINPTATNDRDLL